jgi:pimeloyl-ACP methyl ester carboxylesterase
LTQLFYSPGAEFIVNSEEILSAQLPHLVLLPGLLHDARFWQHQTSGLANVATTWVGDLTKEKSIHDMASAVLSKAPAKKFALAGLSMGGYVALEIMRQAPERIKALALLDTSAKIDNTQALYNRYQSIERAEINFPSVIEALLPKQIHPAHMDNQVLVDSITEMAFNLGKDTFIRQQNAIATRIDSRPHLSRIQCPTLILCGREDAITPLEVHQEMANKIVGSKLVVIEECGHLSALEQPLRVNEALMQWLLKINLSKAA